MPAGIEVKNSAGALITTSEAVQFAQVVADSVVLTDDGVVHPQPIVVGTVSGSPSTNPIIAIKPENTPVSIESASGNSFTLRAQSSSPVVVDYWIYDGAVNGYKDPTLSSAGLQVSTASNQLCFDAAMLAMRVVQKIELSMPSGSPGSQGSEVVQNINIPAGKNYAVVIASSALLLTSYNTGSYAPTQEEVDVLALEGDTIQAGDQWKSMALENFRASVRLLNPNTLQVGLTKFETFRGAYPINTPQIFDSYGKLSFLIIDVTNYGEGTATGPSNPVVSVNTTSRSITAIGTIATTTTPAATISISGGTPPYTILWQKTSGSNSVYIYQQISNTVNLQTQVSDQEGGTKVSATYRARVIDSANNVGYSQEVTFYHTVELPDFIPKPLTLTNLNLNSNLNQASISDVTNLEGFNQNITLRVERYNYANLNGRPNIDAAAVYIYKAPLGTTNWTYLGSFDPRPGGLAYFDAVFEPNTRLHYVIDSVSASGIRQYEFDLVVWNLSNPGGAAQLSNKKITITVDADNNHRVPILSPSASNYYLTVNSNDHDVQTNASFHQITNLVGGNTRLRFSRVHEGIYGQVDLQLQRVFKSTTGSGGPWTEYPIGYNEYVDIDFNNGDWFYTMARARTASGAAGVAWNTYVTNYYSGNLVGSFYSNLQIDQNNDYNVVDATPDTVSWPNISWVTNNNEVGGGAFNTNGPTLVGFNQPISLRFECIAQSSNTDYRGFVVTNHAGSSYGSIDNFVVGSSLTINNINSGATFTAKVSAYSAGGLRETSATWRVVNTTTNQEIGTFTTFVRVDADNNYMFAPTLIDLNYTSNDNYAGVSGPMQTIAGTGQNVQLRFTLSNVSEDMDDGYFYVLNSSGGSIGNRRYSVDRNGYFDVTFSPGQQWYFYWDGLTSSGRQTANFNVNVYSLTEGRDFGTFSCSGVVDNNNDYNVPDYSLDTWSIPYLYANQTNSAGHNFPVTSTYTVTGINRPTTLRFARAVTYHYINSVTGPASIFSHLQIIKNGQAINGGGLSMQGDYSGAKWDEMSVVVNNGDTIQILIAVYVTPHNNVDAVQQGADPRTVTHLQGSFFVQSVEAGYQNVATFSYDIYTYMP